MSKIAENDIAGGLDAMFEIDTLAKWIALVISALTLGGIFAKIINWIRRRKAMKIEKENRILKKLEDLCTGQIMLEKRMIGMDEERRDARNQIALDREKDRLVRSNQFLCNIAILDSIMKLAEHEGLTINGEVAQYRKDNIDFLKTGRCIHTELELREDVVHAPNKRKVQEDYRREHS